MTEPVEASTTCCCMSSGRYRRGAQPCRSSFVVARCLDTSKLALEAPGRSRPLNVAPVAR